jgi:hypothetical protein
LENLKCLIAFCEAKNIPVLVEASGSPGSFHVWIPIVPAPTYTVHKFMKQLLHDAGIKDAEVYPKQKSLKSCGRSCGNFVKMPLGINRSSGVRSYFLDPKTLQPVSCVEVTKVLKLCELLIADSPVSDDSLGSQVRSQSPLNMPFRPCLQAALTTDLSGSQGHLMRVAIASEAYRLGYSLDEAIALFQDQSDFNYSTTRDNLQYIYGREYRRFGCEKLRSNCQIYVNCSNCRYKAANEQRVGLTA